MSSGDHTFIRLGLTATPRTSNALIHPTFPVLLVLRQRELPNVFCVARTRPTDGPIAVPQARDEPARPSECEGDEAGEDQEDGREEKEDGTRVALVDLLRNATAT